MVYEIAKKRSDAEFELVDIKDFNLLLLDEPVRPSLGTILSVAALAIQDTLSVSLGGCQSLERGSRHHLPGGTIKSD
jgi:hypothetical protein